MTWFLRSAFLRKLGSLGAVLAGALVTLGTSDPGYATSERVQTVRFEAGQKEVRLVVRAEPLAELELDVSSGVTLSWLNAPEEMPGDPYRNHIEPRSLRLDCQAKCGDDPCSNYCKEIRVSLTRESTLSSQEVMLTVVAEAPESDLQVIEIERDE